jgi:hypothetical protein
MEPATAPDVSSDEPPVGPDVATTGGSRRHWPWVLVAVALVAAVILGVTNRQAVGHQITLSVSHQPTAFTQLYFTHPNDLPQRLTAPGPDSFSFTIANSEGRTTDYPYTVTLATPAFTSVVSQGTLRVADGGVAVKPVDLFPSASTTDFEVTVRLAERGEVIHFQGGAE